MNDRIKSVAIFSSKKNKSIDLIARQILEIAKSLDIKAIVPKSSSIHQLTKRAFSDSYIINNCDLILSIGGDGTLLTSARRFGFEGLPILGINLGKVGFLTDIAPINLTESLKLIFSGKYISDKRFFLETKLNNRSKNIALNEVVIHSGSIAKLMEYDLFINGKFVYRQRADGLIVSTPTGSTAYSLSGNGPIIHPAVKAITLLPMFPHSLNARPLVISDKDKIELVVLSRGRAKVSFDSHNTVSIKEGDKVQIKKSSKEFQLIHPYAHDFFSASRTKLAWSLEKT